MYNEFDTAKLKVIYRALMEFGSGNLTSRLEPTDWNNDIETLVSLINMTMDQVSIFFHHQGYVNQTGNYNYRVQSFFILDSEDLIVAFNPGVCKLLFFKDSELRAKSFCLFLTDESKLDWNLLKIKLGVKGRIPHNEFIVLSFITKQDSIFIMNCLVGKILGAVGLPEKTAITSVEIETDSEKRKRKLRIKIFARLDKDAANGAPRAILKGCQIILKSRDLPKINKVYIYIQENLAAPLPSLKALAKIAGTNEYRLKHGFKQLYGQSLHSFLKSERMAEAFVLVRTSTMPFTEIATLTGFKFPSHFSLAFMKKYGQTPSDARKLYIHEKSNPLNALK